MSWCAVIAPVIGPAVTVISKIGEYSSDPVGRHIGYVFNYSSNIQKMKVEVENLEFAKERVQKAVEDATRNGEEIFKDVERWLKNVDAVSQKANKILEDEAKNRCFKGWCPNFKTRHWLGREAKSEMQAAVKLQGEGEFRKFSHPTPPQGLRPVKGFEALESRALVLENIVDALKEDDVNLIGVYGMSGVGKTRLVNEAASRVIEDGIFKLVVKATVTHIPDVKKIQQAIADWLDFKLDVDSIEVRAARLSDRLKREEKILVILDDVWQKVKLEEVGIPCGMDHKGSKILMTSRDQNVFLEMDVQRDFRLEVLKEEEAWHLFQKTVGDFEHPELRPVGVEVVKRCAGLPVLIVTIASTLRHKGLPEWSDALQKLKTFDNQGIKAKIYNAMEVSYDFLDAEEKSIFLLCGQARPHYIFISDLLMYSIGLGLFNKLTTVKASRNRLLKVVNDLKRRCLLLEGDYDDHVQMHDVVHEFASSVGTKYHSVFTAAYGPESGELPEKNILQQCTAISFPDRKKIPKFPEVLECPKLLSFIFCSNDSSPKIPDRFFSSTKELKLLDLTDVHLSPVPSSLECLENLQTLCLYHCVLEDIDAIGELKKLQVLSFFDSSIIQLPKQLRNLSRLRILELSRCRRLEAIPAGVLSCLTQLEELFMGNSFVQWEGGDHNCTGNNASLAELKQLPNLATLEMQVVDAKVLPEDLFSKNLKTFRIFIGEEWVWEWPRKFGASKTLKLQLDTSIQLERIKGLLIATKDLYLDDMKGIKTVLYDLEDLGFPELKHLYVRNSIDIQCIVDCRRMGHRHDVFPLLESLTLDYLISLEKICRGAIETKCFSSLRKLNVRNCDGLKNLFSFSMAKGLVQLEEINMSSCKTVKEIVTKETGDNSTTDEEIQLTQLSSLILENLPQFTSFTSLLNVPSAAATTTSSSSTGIAAQDEPETPVPLFNRKITLPNLGILKLFSVRVENIWSDRLIELSHYLQKLTTLTVDGCRKLNYLFKYSMIEGLVQLKNLEICNCEFMEVVVAAQSLREERMGFVLLPKLEFLKLESLPGLISFCTVSSIGCPSLKVLQIERCHQLTGFIFNSVSSNVALNNESGQANSTLLVQQVALPKLEELHVKYMNNLSMIFHDEFQAESLKVLKVEQLKQLLKIFPGKVAGKLETLIVKDCDLLKEVFDDPQVAVAPNNLRTLKLDNLPSLEHVWKWNDNRCRGIVSFDKLGFIDVDHCPNLKTLFPASIARNLPGLQELDIFRCGLVEIVSKEHNSEEILDLYVFPRLRHLLLSNLEKLKSFCSGIHILKCPALQNLGVYHCERLKVFDLESGDMQDTDVETQQEIQVQQPLFSFREVMPKLVELGINNKDITMIQAAQFPAGLFNKLEILHVQCFHDTSAKFPFHLLQIFPNVDNLDFTHCYFEELFQRGTAREDEISLAQIRELRLNFLPEMRHIWNQDCQLDQALKNLKSLEIWHCYRLINLAPSSASFHNLTTLDVWDCNELINLVTPYTVKRMVNLTHLTIRECNKVTEIVANEGDESQSQSQSQSEIIFDKLTSLKLLRLSSLTSFSPSTGCTIKFPSLEVVIVTECPNMEVFCQGPISSPKLQKVCLVDGGGDKWRWVKDLNTTIQQLYVENFSADTELSVSTDNERSVSRISELILALERMEQMLAE